MTVEGILHWLATPISGATTHHIATLTAWHARLMVLSWGILFPLGAFAARFYKIRPCQAWPEELDDKTWWHAHRWTQGIALAVMTAGVALGVATATMASMAASLHAVLGWLLCITGWLQLAAGLARGSKGGPTDKRMRGDHYDMTPRRLVFERCHKAAGWLAILMAAPTIVIGLLIADAPRWMAIVLMLWWISLGAFFVLMHRQGRCVDTYQAIWGPGLDHPGNRIKPVGWGVRRYTAESWRRRPGHGNNNH